MLCYNLFVIVWFPLIDHGVTESSGLSSVFEYLLVVFQYNDHLMNKGEKIRCGHHSAGCLWHRRGKQVVSDRKTNHFNAGR